MPTTPPTPSRPTGPTHYELLQLPSSASSQELRQAFRSLSKRYHPDTTTLPAAQAEESFRRLQRAYAVLIDPASRRAYDAELQPPRPPLAPVRVAGPPSPSRPVSVRRALSGGEWFALLLLAVALVLSLVLGLGMAWARGTELVRRPSWLVEATPPPAPAPAEPTQHAEQAPPPPAEPTATP